MTDRIVLLGTGTCQLQKERMASSILVELGGTRVVFDFGRGICQRLLEVGLGQNDVAQVVLSHFHPDHVSDLIPYLHAARWSRIDPRTVDLHLYGPVGLVEVVAAVKNFVGPQDLAEGPFEIHCHEIREERLIIEDQEFVSVHLPPAGNRGLKFRFREKTYALTGDSHFHEEEVAFLQGVDLAVIDAGHLTDAEIVELAARTQVPILVCSHLYRELSPSRLNLEAQKRGYQGKLMVAQDLMTFDL